MSDGGTAKGFHPTRTGVVSGILSAVADSEPDLLSAFDRLVDLACGAINDRQVAIKSLVVRDGGVSPEQFDRPEDSGRIAQDSPSRHVRPGI